jgi:hypothetical protein
MIMNLTKRPAQIGPSINTRTEKHGEENVPGVDIQVSGLMLDKPKGRGRRGRADIDG